MREKDDIRAKAQFTPYSLVQGRRAQAHRHVPAALLRVDTGRLAA